MNFTHDKALHHVFFEKLVKLNKKLARYDQEIEIVSMVERVVSRTNRLGRKHDVAVLDVEVTEPSIRGEQGVEYVGTITFKNGVRTIYSTDRVVLGSIPNETLTCDHCHTKRRRNTYFAFLKDGEVKLVGSTCVHDWFGQDVEKMLTVWSAGLSGLQEDEGWSTGAVRGHEEWGAYEIALTLGFVTAGFTGRWMKRQATEEYYLPGTVELMRDAWHALSHPTVENRDTREAFHRYADSLAEGWEAKAIENLDRVWGDLNPTSDFEYNIRDNVFDENGAVRLSTPNLGIFAWALWKANYEEQEAEEREERPESNYVGEVGAKVELDITVDRLIPIDGHYGPTTLVIFHDDAGNSLKWFNSGMASFDEEATYHVKGTVKKHDEYKGRKQTILTRVRMV